MTKQMGMTMKHNVMMEMPRLKELVSAVACMLLAVFMLASCKPGVPGKYIQPGKMADILYEYHLAQTLFQQQGGDSVMLASYRANIFDRYEVSEAEFDSSMVYYTRHTRQLYEIYKKVSDRYSNEIAAQGGSNSAFAQYGTSIASGDTANIWKGDMCLVLTPYNTSGISTFEARVDTSFHKGDRIILDFDAQFIYQEGVRTAVAVLTVTFGNDSVATEVRQLMSSSHYHMQIEDGAKLGIKSVRGYFMLGNNMNADATTTLRLAVLYNIQLLKMHVHDAPAADNGAAPDSANADKRAGIASAPPAVQVMDDNRTAAPHESGAFKQLKPVRPVKQLDIASASDDSKNAGGTAGNMKGRVPHGKANVKEPAKMPDKLKLLPAAENKK